MHTCMHMLQNSSHFAQGGACTRRRRLMGKRLVRCRAGIYPPAFLFLGPADPIPPDEGGGPRRGNNNDDNDTMVSPRGPGAIIASRAVRLILSGIPLSLTTEMSIFNFVRNVFHQKLMFKSGLKKPNSHQRCARPSAFMCSNMAQNKLWEAYFATIFVDMCHGK